MLPESFGCVMAFVAALTLEGLNEGLNVEELRLGVMVPSMVLELIILIEPLITGIALVLA